jgi:hypothetical protein
VLLACCHAMQWPSGWQVSYLQVREAPICNSGICLCSISLYLSSTSARIFEEVDLSLPRLEEVALAITSQVKNAYFDIQVFESNNVPPEYERLKSTWEAFIDSIMRKWKTLNIISALLLSCVQGAERGSRTKGWRGGGPAEGRKKNCDLLDFVILMAEVVADVPEGTSNGSTRVQYVF